VTISPPARASAGGRIVSEERDWDPSSKEGWFALASALPRPQPERLSADRIAELTPWDRRQYEETRAVWHANVGPILTPQLRDAHNVLEEILAANRQDGDKVKSAAVIDAKPGLGKSTIARTFGWAFHRDQIDLYGEQTPAGHERIPVAYLGLTSNTTMRSLNAMLCRFYAHPGAQRGNAMHLANIAADCVHSCQTRLIIVDDVHFLDVHRRDGRDVANHFKWLANTFPVTFCFIGVGLHKRGLLSEGLSPADAVLSQTARRWTTIPVPPFEVVTDEGRTTWRQLLLSIETQLVLANSWRGMVADDLADYLFARSTGHFASLTTLISRGCRRAIKTGQEKLTAELLDGIRNDEAAEAARRELETAFRAGRLTTRPASTPIPDKREGQQ
jgi:hypothetical protein